MAYTPLNFVIVFAIIFWAYSVFGIAGFGQTVVAMPLLAQVSSLQFCVPLVLLCDLVFGLICAFRFKEQANYREIFALTPTLVLGIAFGSVMLSSLPEGLLRVAFGLLISVFGIYRLTRPTHSTMGMAYAAPLGFLSGFVAAIFGTGGPINVIYLSARIGDKDQLRSTLAMLLLVSVLMRFGTFGVRGLLSDGSLWVWWISVLPACFLGMSFGNRLHTALNNEHFMYVVYFTLIGSGLLLIVKAF